MPDPVDVDILISGGGIAGLAATAVLARAGFSVLCVDPAPPVVEGAAADLRSTAFLQPSVDLLAWAGLWDRLAPAATALQVMRIVDAGGADGAPRAVHDFDAADVSDRPFGWNLPNRALRREMAAHLAAVPNAAFRAGVGTARVTLREAEARVALSDGTPVRARLLVAADGRDSAVRQMLGIPVRTWRYGQKALTFAVTHPIPHGHVSTEVHRTGGPFTLVPLPDHEGMPASAVVWMERGPEAERLMALDDAAFAAEATARSCHLFGPLTLAGGRAAWPVVTQTAARLTAGRAALVAEAAHVMPPIGAQGLNTSLADIATLRDLAVADAAGLGGPAMLDAYEAARRPQVELRARGVDALNRASMAGAPPLRDLRAAALAVLHGAAPIRRTLMRAGLGRPGTGAPA